MVQRPAVEYSPYRFVILAFLGLSMVLFTIMLLSLGIMLPGISEDLDLSPTEQGWLGSSALLGNLLFALPVSLWISRVSVRISYAAVMLMGALTIFIQAWSPVFVALLLGRMMFGLSAAARHPLRAVLTAQWFPRREIVVVNASVNSTFGVGALVGLALTPLILILLSDSWRGMLVIYSIVHVVVVLAWLVLGREREVARDSASQIVPTRLALLKTVLRYKEVWLLAIGHLGVMLMWGSFYTFWPTLVLDNHDISLPTSGGILSVAGVAESVGSLVLAFYLMKTVKRDLRRALVPILAVVMVSGAVGMSLTGSIPLLVLFSIVHGLGFAWVPIIWTVPFELPGITTAEIAVATGFIEMTSRTGGVIGPSLAGFLQEATNDLQLTLVVTSLFGLTLAVCGVMLFRKPQTQPAITSP